MNLDAAYEHRYNSFLVPIASKLRDFLEELLKDSKRIDRISVRAKSVSRFIGKCEKLNNDGTKKYSDPLTEIQDQIGARIVCFYRADVGRIEEEILKYLRPIEAKQISPESESEFGYFGKHFVLFLPDEVVNGEDSPVFFELQVKTLFQHAWSEAEHDLTYKPQRDLPPDINRKIAFTAAQAWGADQIFNEIFIQTASNDA